MSHPCDTHFGCFPAIPCCKSLDRLIATEIATTCSQQSAGSNAETWVEPVQLTCAGYGPVVRFRARLCHVAYSSVRDANLRRFNHDVL